MEVAGIKVEKMELLMFSAGRQLGHNKKQRKSDCGEISDARSAPHPALSPEYRGEGSGEHAVSPEYRKKRTHAVRPWPVLPHLHESSGLPQRSGPCRCAGR